MDSPPIPLSPVDESNPSRTSLWNLINPVHRGALFGLILSLAVGAALGFCSGVPLWRPIGALVLQRLWDVLRFLVITTSIVVALLNSRHPRRNNNRLNSGKDDSFSSKLPFVGMFHGEVQQLHSYSFNSDKEVEITEDGRLSEAKWEGDNANEATPTEKECAVGARHDVSAASSSTDELRHDVSARPALTDVSAAKTRTDGSHDDEVRTSTVPAMADKFRANETHHAEDDGSVNAEASRNPSVYASQNAISMRSRGQGRSRRLKAHDDLGLPAVAEEPKHDSSKIIHRRGKSSEFPIVQEEEDTSSSHNTAATDVHTAADTQQEKGVSVQQAALSTASGAPRHAKHRRGTSSYSAAAGPGPEHCADTDALGGIRSAAFKHSRSRSAYSLDELLVQQQQQQQRPRSKSGTATSTSSQLSKRRNVSLSCDLDKEYTKGGVPAWLASVPSPPTPPLLYGYSGYYENGGSEAREGNRDDSSLRKAYTESLAPWRAAANTVPVDISREERKEAAMKSHRKPSTTRESMTSAAGMEKKSSPPSSDPSTPISMGSPSPSELNKKVDAFISRFHERMRLQRLESIERAKHRGI